MIFFIGYETLELMWLADYFQEFSDWLWNIGYAGALVMVSKPWLNTIRKYKTG